MGNSDESDGVMDVDGDKGEEWQCKYCNKLFQGTGQNITNFNRHQQACLKKNKKKEKPKINKGKNVTMWKYVTKKVSIPDADPNFSKLSAAKRAKNVCDDEVEEHLHCPESSNVPLPDMSHECKTG